jgi:hypothetical protein
MEPVLVFRKTGRLVALVIGVGFGGGTLLMGVVSALGEAMRAEALAPALRGYFLAALPFFAGAAVLWVCRRELWFVPEARAFRMLTYRPWRFSGPRVEQASVDEYRALCTASVERRGEASTTVVALLTPSGDVVPVREFDAPAEAEAFVADLARATGLPRERAISGQRSAVSGQRSAVSDQRSAPESDPDPDSDPDSELNADR